MYMKTTLKQAIRSHAHFTQAYRKGQPLSQMRVDYDFGAIGDDWSGLPFNNGLQGKLVTAEMAREEWPEFADKIARAIRSASHIGKVRHIALWEMTRDNTTMFPHWHEYGEFTKILSGDRGEVFISGTQVPPEMGEWYVPPYAIHLGNFDKGKWITILVEE
jgi:hypothetical protein